MVTDNYTQMQTHNGHGYDNSLIGSILIKKNIMLFVPMNWNLSPLLITKSSVSLFFYPRWQPYSKMATIDYGEVLHYAKKSQGLLLFEWSWCQIIQFGICRILYVNIPHFGQLSILWLTVLSWSLNCRFDGATNLKNDKLSPIAQDAVWYCCTQDWVNVAYYFPNFHNDRSVPRLLATKQSGRSPKLVALFSATNFQSYII